ncbi:hypothetical protein HDU76_012152, partial [Blyttiomyces sp. JEL0837]
MGYAKQGKITSVMKVFNDAQRRGITPGTALHSAIIKAHSTRLQPGDAENAYRTLRSAGLDAPPSIYSDLIRVHALTGNLTSALSFFYKKERVDGFTPSASMRSELIRAFAVNSELLNSWKAFRKSYKAAGDVFLKDRSDDVGLPLLSWARLHFGKGPSVVRDMLELVEVPKGVRANVAVGLAGLMVWAAEIDAVAGKASSAAPEMGVVPGAVKEIPKYVPVQASKAAADVVRILDAVVKEKMFGEVIDEKVLTWASEVRVEAFAVAGDVKAAVGVVDSLGEGVTVTVPMLRSLLKAAA